MEVLIAAACLYAALVLGRGVNRVVEPVLMAWAASRGNQALTRRPAPRRPAPVTGQRSPALVRAR